MKVYETGHRVAYVPSAVAREDVAPSIEAEFHRRARIASGCFQAIAMTWRALNPLLGFPALAYWSHKVLRWVAPFLYLAALAANVALVAGGSKFFAALLVMQALFFGLAAAGWLLRRAPRSPVLFRLPFYFVTLNAAFIAGFIRWLCGIRSAVWQPAGR
jgi:cellulose synthase/poly-beta-1,6-N-acetylglucosamine synthase-like glycosyltransferase